jgi:hypothetical protein
VVGQRPKEIEKLNKNNRFSVLLGVPENGFSQKAYF